MQAIAEVSNHYTKRFLELLATGKRWNIPLEFKFSPGLTMADLESALADFESYHSRLVVPPEAALSNVKIFNFDDTTWNSGPVFPKGAASHNATIYVSAGGRQWAQDFYLWSSLGGRTGQILRLVFKVEGEDIVTYFDGIYAH
jgi:hypothetical protein